MNAFLEFLGRIFLFLHVPGPAWRGPPSQGNKRTFERSLLGANLLLQCFLFIFLAKGATVDIKRSWRLAILNLS